mgnify:CR=1 FL=1
MSEQYQGLFGTAAAGAATRREDTDVVYNDSNWREGAACRDEDPEQFFFNDNPWICLIIFKHDIVTGLMLFD